MEDLILCLQIIMQNKVREKHALAKKQMELTSWVFQDTCNLCCKILFALNLINKNELYPLITNSCYRKWTMSEITGDEGLEFEIVLIIVWYNLVCGLLHIDECI